MLVHLREEKHCVYQFYRIIRQNSVLEIQLWLANAGEDDIDI